MQLEAPRISSFILGRALLYPELELSRLFPYFLFTYNRASGEEDGCCPCRPYLEFRASSIICACGCHSPGSLLRCESSTIRPPAGRQILYRTHNKRTKRGIEAYQAPQQNGKASDDDHWQRKAEIVAPRFEPFEGLALEISRPGQQSSM
ncbi:hypothetical protein BCR35DRAFT_87218 [Leucosporidium creatinivorum]|uniref:Uncharacterized protein n=1 Tax=Leucosporidium creatinivorum TaxID=106004 RepID=A0A1Y2FBF8_9BASI|nr:hypothetical protein BCR35DRAFT_87218 [Leucosporidium creatinivorum]